MASPHQETPMLGHLQLPVDDSQHELWDGIALRLQPMLPSMLLIFCAASLAGIVLAPLMLAGLHALALTHLRICAAVYGLVFILFSRYRPLPIDQLRPLLLVLPLLPIVLVYLYVWQTVDFSVMPLVMLIILANSIVWPHPIWSTALQVGAGVGYLIVCAITTASSAELMHGLFLGLAIVLAFSVSAMLRWRMLQMDVLQRENASRQHALAQAYAEIEKTVRERTSALERSLVRERELTHDLEQALDQAAHLDQLRSHIITVVSHEFRTPLTVINTSANILENHMARLTESRRARQHERIRESIAYLNDMLQDVILVNKINSDGVTPRFMTTTFGSLVDQLVHSLGQNLGKTERLQIITNHQDMPVWTDIQLLPQLVGHLLCNALSYSDPETPVMLRLDASADELHIALSDQGFGIPADEQRYIFDLFSRGSNIGNARGLGLGLYIAKRIVDALEGTISFESAEGSGTTFYLSLPISPERTVAERFAEVPEWLQVPTE